MCVGEEVSKQADGETNSQPENEEKSEISFPSSRKAKKSWKILPGERRQQKKSFNESKIDNFPTIHRS
jgi:hypothetical protein